MESSNLSLINFTEVNRRRGYSEAGKNIRKSTLPRLKGEDKEAVEALVNAIDNWAEKYTKTK